MRLLCLFPLCLCALAGLKKAFPEFPADAKALLPSVADVDRKALQEVPSGSNILLVAASFSYAECNGALRVILEPLNAASVACGAYISNPTYGALQKTVVLLVSSYFKGFAAVPAPWRVRYGEAYLALLHATDHSDPSVSARVRLNPVQMLEMEDFIMGPLFKAALTLARDQIHCAVDFVGAVDDWMVKHGMLTDTDIRSNARRSYLQRRAPDCTPK